MKFRGGEFSTGTMRNFQPELTLPPNGRIFKLLHLLQALGGFLRFLSCHLSSPF
jgi:hypothetical protein